MGGPDDFLLEDNWLGSYYELAMKLGPRHGSDADRHLEAAVRALWSHPNLDGCFLDRRTAPSQQQRVEPSDVDPALTTYGLASLPIGRIVVVVHVVREDGPAGADWLDLCLPTGALETLEPRLSYPIAGESSRSWRLPLDEWFVGIADAVARHAGFESALIGEEVSGLAHIADEPPSRRAVSVVTTAGNGVELSPPDRW